LWHIPKNKLAKKLLMMILKSTAVVVCIALLGACSSSPNGVRVTKDGTSATSSKQGATIRDFTSAEIGSAVVGKTFQYTRKDGTGFVVYNADGSLTITDDQKGASKGTWKTSGTQYCESYGAGALECGVFKYTGDAYFAANSRLVEMKI
jgi:hypothetical protein